MDKPGPSNQSLRNYSKKSERAGPSTNRRVWENTRPPQLANIGKSQKTVTLSKQSKKSGWDFDNQPLPRVASTSMNNQIPVDTSNMREAQQDLERNMATLRTHTRLKCFPTSSLSPARNHAVFGQADNKGQMKYRSFSQNPAIRKATAAATSTNERRAPEEQKNRSRAPFQQASKGIPEPRLRTPAQDDVLQKFSEFIGSEGEFTEHQTKGYGIVLNQQFYKIGQSPRVLPNNLFILKKVRDPQWEKFRLQIDIARPDDAAAHRKERKIVILDPELGVPFGGETYRRQNSGEEEKEVNKEPGTSGQRSWRAWIKKAK